MVTLLYGYQGSGKSYHALSEYIIPAMKKGMHVFTNLEGIDPFLVSQLHSTKDCKIDPSLLHAIPKEVVDENGVISEPIYYFWSLAIGNNTLFVIDEVQNYYGSSNFRENQNSGLREGLKKYIALSRHRGDSVVFICQEPMMVDSVVRDLCEHWVHVRKLNFLFGGKTKQYICNHRKGGPKGELIKTQHCKYDPRVFVCYNSTDPGVMESETASDAVRFSYVKLLWWVPLVIIAFIAILVFFHHLTHKGIDDAKKTPISDSLSSGKNPPRIVSADGWFQDDSLCIEWLKGASPVARSCPDPGARAGRLPCEAAIQGPAKGACLVDVVPGALSGSDSPEDTGVVGHTSSGTEVRSSAPAVSSVPSSGGG